MTVPAKIYDSITDLLLSKFIDCLVNDNLYALVITGDPVKEDLQTAWNDIIIQYNDALGDAETKMYVTLLKDVMDLKADIRKIEMCLTVLRFPYYDEFFTKELNILTASKFSFDISNKEQYFEELDRCERITNGRRLRLKLKEAAFQAIKEKEEVAKKPSKEYFLSTLITLSDFAGYNITEEQITVYVYCERMRRLEKYNKEIQEKNNSA